MKARIAVAGAVIAAIYEAVAVFTNAVPTITEILEAGPDLVEAVVLGSLIGWLLWHFGWLPRREASRAYSMAGTREELIEWLNKVKHDTTLPAWARLVAARARNQVQYDGDRSSAFRRDVASAYYDGDFPNALPVGSQLSMFIQWKGTDICVDVACPCGHIGHIDDDFAYEIVCTDCGQVYEMGTQVIARKTDTPRELQRPVRF